MPIKNGNSVSSGKRGRPAMPSSALGNYIQQEMDARGWTQQDLVVHSGVSDATIRRLIKGADPQKIKKEAIYDIAQALGVSFGHMLTLAGYKLDAIPNDEANLRRLASLHQTFPWLGEDIDRLTKLTPEQRKAVRALLDVMAKQQENGEG